MLDPTYRADARTPELTLTRDLRQPPGKVWTALVTPERFADWMGVEWRGDPEVRLGARFSWLFRNANLLTEGRVTAFEPERRLEHGWFENTPGSHGRVRWALSPREGGTRLELTHIFETPDDAARTGSGWSDLLDQLAQALGDPADPHVAEGFNSLRRRLRGLLPPAALRDGQASRRADGGWTLTYDRRIAHPVARVWEAVSTQQGVAAWMLADATVEPRVGGRYRLAFHGFDHVMDGEITHFEPPHRIAYTWPESQAGRGSQVAIDLAPDGAEGTRLVLTHDLASAHDIYPFAAGWHWHLDQVELLLGGAAPVRNRPREMLLRTAYAMTLFADLPGGAPEEASASAA